VREDGRDRDSQPWIAVDDHAATDRHPCDALQNVQRVRRTTARSRVHVAAIGGTMGNGALYDSISYQRAIQSFWTCEYRRTYVRRSTRAPIGTRAGLPVRRKTAR
jgi:hypothetical protein